MALHDIEYMASLIHKVAEQKKEIAELHEQHEKGLLLYQNMCNTVTEGLKEIERLKGLVESLHTEARGINPTLWLQYKKLHNL